MYASTGVARYVNRLQRSLQDLGARVIPFQPFPDESLATRSTKKRLGALVADWALTPRAAGLLCAHHAPCLVHYTHAPLRMASAVSVVTVYDLNIMHAHEDFSAYSRLIFNQRLQSLERATALIAISDFVRSDLVRRFPSWSEKTTTVHLGTNLAPKEQPAAHEKKRAFVYVGGIGPNKNLRLAITSFAEASRSSQERWEFNIIGPVINNAYHQELLRLVQELQVDDNVHFLGVLPDETVAEYYRNSFGLLFVSLREGFGFPVVEAQANGCLCIVSNTTCMPEIGGDGCLYVDPTDGAAIVRALQAAMSGSAPIADLINAGLRNAERFSWERCARETLAVYDTAYRRGSR